jgi:RNA polymerase sigma-70 factor, ECF subfamily
MTPGGEDWAAVLERLLDGDRLALLQLSRLINSFLGRWNAYDFRDEWDDLIQEVVLAAAQALREGRLRERAAVVGYLRTTTRFKFVDRLKRHLRCQEDETLPWEEVVESSEEPADEASDGALRRDLQRALAALPEKQRAAVVAVHVEGRTYPDAADATGIPLGSLKRHLRDGLAALRGVLSPLLEDP